ncbi:hypothetical protein MTX26_01170 [Bradyrhizobium sp. ISRA443]|uniref:PspA/IM30 family protein n=1 Tax=unclassified Bradyrhizobium TaxID=2631580 RepID=UPI0024799D5A|nr:MULTISPECIES: hypothetical protein [unclassified Bradyrhizobium]WGR94701.1 hypothetical protein MTX20_11190 [Bradyrhizobium sp. ISRA435]WGR99516.1 hypothetical protein MTX23_01170 [Bradyrhizobium sp. ISRA436]WGS06406.1 hypothetical protein MTX18_01170 [Bradyrhizobium sp. ISRA437]WGS13290.1 hypothetical protein MTX26_01170 [Bradyrhizobium sp. ISRA443]
MLSQRYTDLEISKFGLGFSSRRAALLAATALSIFSSSSAFAADERANEALLKKLDKMERRIEALEAELKQKDSHQQADAGTKSSSRPASIRSANATASSADAKEATDAKQEAKGAKGKPEAQSAETPARPMLNLPPLPAAGDKPILGLADSPVPGLSIGAYGEVKFGAVQNPAANGQWQNGFDAQRFVLLPTYAITPNIIFNAEIEFEHAGSGFDNDDKLHGTAEIEQLWVDFKILDQFNWRAPGIDLVPIGYINQHHEPTQFYSVNRPELYNGLIPSTWKVPSSSVYGTISEDLKYQVMVSTSNEDFGDSFDNRTEAKTVPLPGTPYAAGIDGLNGLGFSRPPLGDFQQLNNAVAVSGRLDVTPTFLPGFAGSVSAYYSPNTTPRGAHDDFGNFLGHSSLTMFDAEFRYRVPDTGLELRGEYVRAEFGHPENLRANNDSDPTNNVGKTMYGYSGEVAYHVPLGTIMNSEWEAVPFYRYTYQNLQTGGFAGTDANLPTGAGQRQFHIAGFALFPSPKIALKATYQHVIDKSITGAMSDSFLGGVGFFF